MPEAKTFDGFDLLGRKQFAERLLEEIELGFQMVEGALVIALNAPFGGGKSTFLEMWKNELQRPDKEGGPYEVLSINAWETDFAENPVIPIATTFIEHMAEHFENEAAGAVSNISRKALVMFAAGMSQLLRKAVGIDAAELLRTAEEMDIDQETLFASERVFTTYQMQLRVYKEMREALSAYVTPPEGAVGKPLFVFVDELDRARPDYAVEFLETIKHLYGVSGVVYVLAVDQKQLEATVKVRFGEGTDFGRYIRRFVQLERSLPPALGGRLHARPIEDWVTSLVGAICRDSRNPISESYMHEWARRIVVILEIFSFEPRDLHHFLRHLTPLLRSGRVGASEAHVELLTLLVALYLADRKMFERVHADAISFRDAMSVVMNKSSLNLPEQKRVAVSFLLGLANERNMDALLGSNGNEEVRALISNELGQGESIAEASYRWFHRRSLGETSEAKKLCEKIVLAQSLFH